MKEKQNETEKIVMLNQLELIDFEENSFKVINHHSKLKKRNTLSNAGFLWYVVLLFLW